MSRRKTNPILVICGDPGGANAIVPVIKKLYSLEKINALVFTYRQASDIMLQNNISFSVLDETITKSEIEDLLQKSPPAIVVTGTSFNPIGVEIKFIHAARKLKIPTLAILDFWTNYSLRFSDEHGKMKYIPDKIAVMDNVAFREMIAEGFDPDTLVITGQPAFDTLAVYKLNFNIETRQNIRHNFKIDENELFVVFVSQPLSSVYGEDESNSQFLGYTEKTVIKDLVDALDKISQDCEKKITLIIRPHPRESSYEYQKITSNVIRIIVSNDSNPRYLVMSSDLVIGMNTELLVEACYLGCIVVSLQPGLRFKDVLPTNNEGYSVPVYSKEKIIDTIRMTLIDSDIRSEMKNKVDHFKQDGHAADRVVGTIIQMMETANR